MNHASDRSGKIKFRRFDFFDYMSIAVNVLSAIFLFILDIISTSGSRFVLVTYLIFSVMFWIDVKLRLSRISKDLYLISDRHRSGYRDDIVLNGKEIILSLIVPVCLAPPLDQATSLVWFACMNLGMLTAEMTIFAEQKPKIKEPIDEKIANLRAEIINLFYSQIDQRLSEEITDERLIGVCLNLAELDYYLNHTDLLEEDYEELRSELDEIDKNRSLSVDFIVFKLTCKALLHSTGHDQGDKVRALKERAINAANLSSLYSIMRYLD